MLSLGQSLYALGMTWEYDQYLCCTSYSPPFALEYKGLIFEISKYDFVFVETSDLLFSAKKTELE